MWARFRLIAAIVREDDPSDDIISILEDKARIFTQLMEKIYVTDSRSPISLRSISEFLESCLISIRERSVIEKLPIDRILRVINPALVSNSTSVAAKDILLKMLFLLGEWNYYVDVAVNKTLYTSTNSSNTTTEAEWQYDQGLRAAQNKLAGGFIACVLTPFLTVAAIPLFKYLANSLAPDFLPFVGSLLATHPIIFLFACVVPLGTILLIGMIKLGSSLHEWLGRKFSPARPVTFQPFSGNSFRYEPQSSPGNLLHENKNNIPRHIESKRDQNNDRLPSSLNVTPILNLKQKLESQTLITFSNHPPEDATEFLERYDLLYNSSLFHHRSLLVPLSTNSLSELSYEETTSQPLIAQ